MLTPFFMKNEKTQLSIVQNTGKYRTLEKYRTAAKIQEFTGFTGPLESLHDTTSS